MKISHWRSQKDEDLVASLKEISREGYNLRFQRASGQLEKTSQLRSVRRDIARLKMLLHQRRKQTDAKES